jgi:hypothetical protein
MLVGLPAAGKAGKPIGERCGPAGTDRTRQHWDHNQPTNLGRNVVDPDQADRRTPASAGSPRAEEVQQHYYDSGRPNMNP